MIVQITTLELISYPHHKIHIKIIYHKNLIYYLNSNQSKQFYNNKYIHIDPMSQSSHSLNNSTSKMKYSFCKANRFLPPIKSECQIYYDTPTLKNKRSTSFGYGNKANLNTSITTPSPDTYTQPSDFNKNIKNKGFTFGFGRDETVGGPLAHTRYTKQVPGPGAYPSLSTLDTHLITLKPKLPDFTVGRKSYVPGPGTYNPPSTINATGHYTLSTQSNSRATIFSKCKTVNNSQSFESPGPGSYPIYEGINKSGKYFQSNHYSSLVRSFSKSPRSQVAIKHLVETPGPGTYKPFSQFQSI